MIDMPESIPVERTPLVFSTKLWKTGRKGLIIPVPKELMVKAEKWRGEEIYCLVMPASELQRQEIIIKSKEKSV